MATRISFDRGARWQKIRIEDCVGVGSPVCSSLKFVQACLIGRRRRDCCDRKLCKVIVHSPEVPHF